MSEREGESVARNAGKPVVYTCAWCGGTVALADPGSRPCGHRAAGIVASVTATARGESSTAGG